MRCTASCVTTGTGELLPHLFTLAPSITIRGGYFLLHCYTLADIFPLGSMVLFVARTFLSPFDFAPEPRWNGLLRHKGNKNENIVTNWLFLQKGKKFHHAIARLKEP